MREEDSALPSDLSEDALLGGGLRLLQRRGGYRYSVDALLLAHEALALLAAGAVPLTVPENATQDAEQTCAPWVLDPGVPLVIDAGAGCGVIALLVASLWEDLRVIAIEGQAGLMACCRANIVRNGLSRRVRPLAADLRNPPPLPPAGLVLMNPPFFAADQGRLAPDPERAAARHRLAGDLDALIEGCRKLLAPDGRLVMVYPARGESELRTALRVLGSCKVSTRIVQSGPEGEPRLVLVHAQLNQAEPCYASLPPLRLHAGPPDASGRRPYTPEIQMLMSGTAREAGTRHATEGPVDTPPPKGT